MGGEGGRGNIGRTEYYGRMSGCFKLWRYDVIFFFFFLVTNVHTRRNIQRVTVEFLIFV